MKERYIKKQGNKYIIRKSVNHKLTYFGSYKSLEEAVEMRDKLQKNGWKKEIKLKKYMGEDRYIRKYVDRYGNIRWGIAKRKQKNPKDYMYYGIFSSKEEAKTERDLLEQYDWDYENICSSNLYW